jgi:uncharacterized membrane protein
MNQQFQSGDITSDDKLWAMLAYILSPIVPIIILLMEDKKNRPFLKAHNIQALIWGIVVYLVAAITSPIFIGLCIGPVGFIISILWGLKANKGEMVEIPVLTNFVKQQGWS